MQLDVLYILSLHIVDFCRVLAYELLGHCQAQRLITTFQRLPHKRQIHKHMHVRATHYYKLSEIYML